MPSSDGAAAARSLIETYCLKCHSARRHKGDVVLEGLPPTFDGDHGALWTLVHDKLAAGEMPPARQRRPSEAELAPVLSWLTDGLTAADLAQRTELRRLDRTEYENTVRDVLGVDVRLRDLLPDDGTTGFETDGASLAVSNELMRSYLDAAEVALDAALGEGPPPRQIDMLDKLHGPPPDLLRNGLQTANAMIVFHSRGITPTDFNGFVAPVDGHYELRLKVAAYHCDRVVMEVMRQSRIERVRLPIEFFEVGPEPQFVVLRPALHRGDRIKVVPSGLGTPKIEDPKHYEGPGLAIHGMHVKGPLEAWPPPSRRRILGDVDPAHGTLDDVQAILARFLPRAFRRPLGPHDADPYLDLARCALEQGQDFTTALRTAMTAALCSPRFLYLGPRGTADDYDIACKLSYFLWSGPPDEALTAAAAAGKLADPSVRRGQVERMLQDPKAEAFTVNFTDQWLRLKDIDATVPDPKLYPEYDDELRVAMVEETRRFFQDVLDHDRSVMTFVDSSYSFLNERLAHHYGIDGVQGLEYRRVDLPKDSHRGGLLTQASILKLTANGTTTSPVKRGVWVLDNILGAPSPPPPPNVPAIEPDIRGATTIREQLARHRDATLCQRCHHRIDPPGFALESFDVIGGWRDHYRVLVEKAPDPARPDKPIVDVAEGPVVDPSGQTPDGDEFAGIDQYKALLMQHPDEITRGLIEKVLSYAEGRKAGFADRPTIEDILRAVKEHDHGFRTLVEEVAQRL